MQNLFGSGKPTTLFMFNVGSFVEQTLWQQWVDLVQPKFVLDHRVVANEKDLPDLTTSFTAQQVHTFSQART